METLRAILKTLGMPIQVGRGSFMSNMSNLLNRLHESGYDQLYDQYIDRTQRNWISRYLPYLDAIYHDFHAVQEEEPPFVEDFPDREEIVEQCEKTKILGKLFRPGTKVLNDDISLTFGPSDQDLALYALQQIKQGTENPDNSLWGSQKIAITLDREATEQDGAKIRNQLYTRVLPVSYFTGDMVVVPDSLTEDVLLRVASDQGMADRIDITRIREIKIFTMERPSVDRELALIDIKEKIRHGEGLSQQEQIALDYDRGNITEQNNPYNDARYCVRQRHRVERSGAFFPYMLQEGIALDAMEQRLFDIIASRGEHCLIHCLRYFLVPEPILLSISQRFQNSDYILIRHLKEIALDYGLTIRLHLKELVRIYGNEGLVVDIYCDYRNHFIIFERSIMKFYRRLFDERLVRKMNSVEYYTEREALGTCLSWVPSCIDSRLKNYQFKEDYDGTVMFGDFETIYKDGPHRVYLWKLKHRGNMYMGYDVESFLKKVLELAVGCTKAKRTAVLKSFQKAFGVQATWCSQKRAIEQYPSCTEWIRNNWKRPRVRCYFHNLSFDGCFIISQYQGNKLDVIEKGTELWTINIRTKEVVLQFVDSLKLIRAPLRKFPSLFGLSVQKELLPYDLITRESLEQYTDPKSFREWITGTDWFQGLTQEDKEHFMRVSAGLNLLQYSAYYCGLDVEVLAQGFNIFRENMRSLAGLDVCNYLSLPSLAYDYLQREALSKIQGLYEYSGVIDRFVRRCAIGGRVATIKNQKCLVNLPLCDFDAVSLYPTAMCSIQIPVGKEDYFEGGSLYELEKRYAYFIIEVRVRKELSEIIIHRNHAPFIIPNNGSLAWSDWFKDDCTCYFDSILLKSIVQGYGCIVLDYMEVVCGLGWRQVTQDCPLRPCIEKIFNERLKAKKQGNTIASEIFKLLMNSSYGKLGQHPIYSKTVIKKNTSTDPSKIDEDNRKYMERNKVEDFEMVGDKLKFKIQKNLLAQFRDIVVYNQILSASKAQMYRVMFLAEDLGIKIFYQDTDSMHIEYDRLDELAQAYQERYGERLIGSGLGQFHSDFCPNDGTVLEPGEEILYARRSIFLGKKAYIDELVIGNNLNGVTSNKGRICYMFRMKGISHAVILKKARDMGCTVWELYEMLSRGEELSFNLAELNPCMVFKNYTVVNQKEFVRRIRFGGDLHVYEG